MILNSKFLHSNPWNKMTNPSSFPVSNYFIMKSSETKCCHVTDKQYFQRRKEKYEKAVFGDQLTILFPIDCLLFIFTLLYLYYIYII